MKKFTIVFTTGKFGDDYTVLLISQFVSVEPANKKILYFKSWPGSTLKEAYQKYLKNPEGKWCSEVAGDTGCSGWRDMSNWLDMYYEISKEELNNLLKMEELTGGL